MAGAGEKGGDRYGGIYLYTLTRCDDDMRDLRAIRIRLRGCAFTFIYYGSILDINKMEGFCARGSIGRSRDPFFLMLLLHHSSCTASVQ
jgi:hypothetical protein